MYGMQFHGYEFEEILKRDHVDFCFIVYKIFHKKTVSLQIDARRLTGLNITTMDDISA